MFVCFLRTVPQTTIYSTILTSGETASVGEFPPRRQKVSLLFHLWACPDSPLAKPEHTCGRPRKPKLGLSHLPTQTRKQCCWGTSVLSHSHQELFPHSLLPDKGAWGQRIVHRPCDPLCKVQTQEEHLNLLMVQVGVMKSGDSECVSVTRVISQV